MQIFNYFCYCFYRLDEIKAKDLEINEKKTLKKGAINENIIAILTISGNKINLGSILNSNNEIKELLGYNKNDLLG